MIFFNMMLYPFLEKNGSMQRLPPRGVAPPGSYSLPEGKHFGLGKKKGWPPAPAPVAASLAVGQARATCKRPLSPEVPTGTDRFPGITMVLARCGKCRRVK